MTEQFGVVVNTAASHLEGSRFRQQTDLPWQVSCGFPQSIQRNVGIFP